MTENNNQTRTAIKPLTLLAIAGLLGGFAGAAAVYVKGGPSVHGIGETAQTVAAAPSTCPLDEKRMAAIGAAATGDVAAMTPAKPSADLRSLAFNGPDGKPMSIASLSGKALLVNLWATWCVPCREEMPALNALQAKAGDVAFEVVAVNVDADEGAKRAAFRAETGISALKDYFEPTMALFNDAKRQGLAFGLPVTMLIGEDGCLLASMNGPANWSGDDALRLINAAKAR